MSAAEDVIVAGELDREALEAARASLAEVLAGIDGGDLAARSATRAYVAGAHDALARLLGEDLAPEPEPPEALAGPDE